MKEAIKPYLSRLRGALTQNWGWKIISVIFACILWYYVISMDSTITRQRDMAVRGADIGTTTATLALENRNLAIKTNENTSIPNVVVRISVPQASFARVTPDTVKVELDASRVRQTGLQSFRLTATTSIGRIVEVIPPTVDLEVEALDERRVPVNITLTDKSSYYHYEHLLPNPSDIIVRGPSSVVERLASAQVFLSMKGFTATRRVSSDYVLYDYDGNEISQQLSVSSSSVTVNINVYPSKQVPIDVETATIGELPEGYEIIEVDVQPVQTKVAGETSLLNQIEYVTVEPLDVTGHTESFYGTQKIRMRSDLYYSATQADVRVIIREMQRERRIEGVPIAISGMAAGKCKLETAKCAVNVKGLYHDVNDLEREDITATVNVEGLPLGVHQLPINIAIGIEDGTVGVVDPQYIEVTIS